MALVNSCPELPKNNRYTIAEAAKILGCNAETLRRAAKRQYIKVGYRKGTGFMFVTGGEIMRYWNMSY